MNHNSHLTSPTLLNRQHDVSRFDCGYSALNRYLQKHALQNIQNGSARTYVTVKANQSETYVVGYYTLAYGSVSHAAAPGRVSKGLGQYPIPLILLARLAVCLSEKGLGLGKGLLKDALLRSLQAAEIAGLRAVLVHAKDNSAKKFYEKFGFETSPVDEYHLYLLMKDLKRIVLH